MARMSDGAAVATAGLVLAGVLMAGFNLVNIATSEWTNSKGTRTGTITRVSDKGYFIETREGEMAMPNLKTKMDGSLGNTFEFSVRPRDNDIWVQLQKAQDSGNCTEVKYEEKVGHRFWEQKTDTRIVGVKDMGAPCGQNPAPVVP